MPIQFIELCMMRRRNELTLDEFRQRILAMLGDLDAVENIAIDVEQLVLQHREDHC